MIYTTLNRIRRHSPSDDVWRKLLTHLGKSAADDDPLAYSVILDAAGLDDALWCLRAEPQHSNIWRMYAVRAARAVQHLMKNESSIHALDVAERHARGEAKDAELDAARYAAGDAAEDAAGHAAHAATIGAAWDAAWEVTGYATKAVVNAWVDATVWHAPVGAAWGASKAATRDAAWGQLAADFRALLAEKELT